MSDICIFVTDINSPNPYTTFVIDYRIMVRGQADVGNQSVTVDHDDTASDINEALIADAITALAGMSVTVSATDTKRVVGGAHGR